MFGEPAMCTETAKGILQGRPAGGVAVLVKNNLVTRTTCLQTIDRMVSLIIDKFLIINVYMPVEDGSESRDLVLEILSSVIDVISECDYEFILFGGDLNLRSGTGNNSKIINNFLKDIDCDYCEFTNNPTAHYTFGNDKLLNFSVIDFLCLSNVLLNRVSCCETMDNVSNFSDHLSVSITFTLPTHDLRGVNAINSDNNISNEESEQTHECNAINNGCLRFDHGNHAGYYDCTRLLLEPILYSLDNFLLIMKTSHGFSNEQVNDYIEELYEGVVHALNQAAEQWIPRIKTGGLKHWWDEELDALKKQAIASNNLWVDSGRPRQGLIYKKKNP
jgi:hypothetical protein